MAFDSNLRRRFCAAVLVLPAALALGGCARRIPDTDGTPGQAVPLELGAWRTNQLHCRTGDCADWYRIVLREKGDLRIDVVASQDVTRNFALGLHDSSYETLARASSAGTGRAQVFETTGRGTYLIVVETPGDTTRAPLSYEVQARFKPEPEAPPPPQPDLVRADVIEIEGAGEPEAVLVDKGRDAGLEVGQRGRLVEGENEIGRVEVKDVYPEGSRLRIDGGLSAPITHTTKAVIEVPAGTLSSDEEQP